MKRLILLVIAVFFCLPMAVYAASIGGAETQGQGEFAIGLDQEFLFDRDMKSKSWSFEEDVSGIEFTGSVTTKPEIDKMYRTMVKASYGVLENLDVYVKLGTADGESKEKYSGVLDWDEGQVTISGTGKYKTDNAFAYGFGMKGNYDLPNDWLIGADIQYLRNKNDYKASGSATFTDVASGDVLPMDLSWEGKITVQEWHIAPYLAKKLGNFVPYLGVKYSNLEVKDKDEDGEKEKYKADDNFGVFLGTDYKIGENWKLNLEGRFIDETALSFAGSYKF